MKDLKLINKIVFIILVNLLIGGLIFAQVPQKMIYQDYLIVMKNGTKSFYLM